MLRRIRTSRAFTLVELMIVVAIIGLLAALAIYGVRRYMTNSKTAEGRQALGAITKGARAAFEGEVWTNTDVIAAGQPSEVSSGKLCPDATAVPADPPVAAKYQSTDADWPLLDEQIEEAERRWNELQVNPGMALSEEEFWRKMNSANG